MGFGVTRLPAAVYQRFEKLKGLNLRVNALLLEQFFARFPGRTHRFSATFPLYAKYFNTEPPLLNEAILHKLTNPDQTPRTNATCAYMFANPERLKRSYQRGGTKESADVSMIMDYPELKGLFLDKISAGSRVLSLGFGNGVLEGELVTQGCQVVGIDFFPSRVKAGRDKGIEAIEGILPGALAKVSGEFDYIVMSEVLGDLDPHQIFRQVEPLLKRRGSILLSTYLPELEDDGTGYERHWSISLEGLLGRQALAVIEKRVWEVKEEGEKETIKPVESCLDVEGGYAFYLIGRRVEG